MGLTLSASGGANGSNPQPLTITIPANAAVCLLASFNAGSGQSYFQGSVADTGPGGNTYVAAGGTNSAQANGQYDDAFYCLNTSSSATSITYTPSASYTSMGNVGIAVWVWTASGGTVTFGSVIDNAQTAAVGTGTDAITSTAVTCSTGSVVMGLTRDNDSGPVSVGTGFTSDYNGFNILIGEHGTFSSNHAATWTTATGTDARILSQALSFGFSATSGLADGYSASSATVVTGTSGTAMGAVSLNQVIDVMFRANSSNAGTCTVADTLGNTYTQIDHYDDTTQGYEFYRFYSVITHAGTSQITATYHIAPVNMEIAVATPSTLTSSSNPFTAGRVAHLRQNTPVSGTNAQTSGLVPAPTSQPTTLAAWGYNQGDVSAPTAGTGFTQVGTAWSTINSQASVTYETQNLTATVQTAATFTPNATNNCFTFAAIFNQPAGAVTPSGPMPRQLYVMP